MYRNVKCVAAHKTFQKPQKVIKMNKNIKNKAEITITELSHENRELKQENKRLTEQLSFVIEKYTTERAYNKTLENELKTIQKSEGGVECL